MPFTGTADRLTTCMVTSMWVASGVRNLTPLMSNVSMLPPPGFTRMLDGASPAGSITCGPGQLVPVGSFNWTKCWFGIAVPLIALTPVFCRM